VIDEKSGGYIVRVMSNEASVNNGSSSKLKNDMIGIASPQPDGTVKLETRVIAEVVNDYTFILDRPFNNLGL
jgi:hypothetical protein